MLNSNLGNCSYGVLNERIVIFFTVFLQNFWITERCQMFYL